MIKFDELSLLSGKVQKPLDVIKNKLGVDYLPFFENVSRQYTGSRLTKEQKVVKQTIELIQKTVLDIMEAEKISDISVLKKRTDKILESLKTIQSAAEWLSNVDNISNQMQGRLEQASKDTNTTIGDIKRTSKIITGRTQQVLKRPSKLGLAYQSFKGSDTGEQLGASISNMFGPFSGIAKMIGGGVRGALSFKEALGKRAFSEATITGGPRQLGALEEQNKFLWGKEEVPIEIGSKDKTTSSESRKTGKSKSDSIGKTILNKTIESMFGGLKQTEGISQSSVGGGVGRTSLFDFFNVGAYKAKWTKELLESVSGKEIEVGGQKGGGSGLFGGLFNKIGDSVKSLSAIGPTLAVAGAGLAGWGAGRWIGGQKVGDKTVDEHVTGFAQKRMESSDKKKREKERKSLRPEVRRALELQDQGVPIRESVAQAQKELSISTVEKIPSETKEGILVQNMKQQQDGLVKSLNEIAINTKPKQPTINTSSRNDDKDVGDPLIDSASFGVVDIKG